MPRVVSLLAALLLHIVLAEVITTPNGVTMNNLDELCRDGVCLSFDTIFNTVSSVESMKHSSAASAYETVTSPVFGSTVYSDIGLSATLGTVESGAFAAVATICAQVGNSDVDYFECTFKEFSSAIIKVESVSRQAVDGQKCGSLSHAVTAATSQTFTVMCKATSNIVTTGITSQLSLIYVAAGVADSADSDEYCANTADFSYDDPTNLDIFTTPTLSISVPEPSMLFTIPSVTAKSPTGWLVFASTINGVTNPAFSGTHFEIQKSGSSLMSSIGSVGAGAAEVALVTGIGNPVEGVSCIQGHLAAFTVPNSAVVFSNKISLADSISYTYYPDSETDVVIQPSVTFYSDTHAFISVITTLFSRVINAGVIVRLYVDNVVVAYVFETLTTSGFDQPISLNWAGKLYAGPHEFKVTVQGEVGSGYTQNYGAISEKSMTILAVREQM